ncbi:GFA family protein [Diaphorobacter ruginosibacter]|jgi:hypothetical protein|uniref:GFA family protein n=1 Tax=Diaphorobacter ruginosibacter TaxID=1715720 RepID=A0A7G9RMI0_9BURK|nr:GFA family protein [Diaphorobacter ruginosibacter]MDR2336335.1 GFA family protein [Burkholderiaceae bacterium]QNN56805.1 GFA family protein [Diaphorobacter ruginosibacter]
MRYQASCHCGRNVFEFDGELKEALACNCSMCQRRGSLLAFVPRTALHLKTPEEASKVYTFHKHAIRHHFCPECGIHLYGEARHPKTGEAMAAVNIRCVEGLDLHTVPVREFDGRSLP